ncbi:MalY/PatB family protein [Klenkia sp. PcliD-1-E]|uniref:MalY/PatB family protein n=1 Tax=Klenkia sp. PcliD-1-E TaxID=2954492 RepID=UPI0020972BAD|nr:aminotransferase class I/II-fold pyridoxal phosphate-dependent enzyme [Klenkia sp. PcliD-1-E]MCO7219839.1 aminotransferase class I/II-fold pyridoxal phosphate-dependent enzyme [Klenkia sp. PcliD-1-E]
MQPEFLTLADTVGAARRRSEKWAAEDPDVLPLTVAELDVALAPPVADVLAAAVAASDTGYPSAAPGLGRAWAGFAERRWGWILDSAAVRAVPDVGVGVVEVLRALGARGRTVAFSPPVYPPFWSWADEVGAQVCEVPLARDPWRLDLPALDRAFAEHRPVAYLLCSPHNPVGRVHGAEELAELVALAARHGVRVVADEIHAPLTLPGAVHTPLLAVPGAAEVAVSVLSASKAFNLAGLKCAAVVSGSPAGRAVLDRLSPDLTSRTGHLGVLASLAALDHGDAWLDGLLTELAARFDQLGDLLGRQLPEVRWARPEATYLAWLDVSALPGDPVEVFRRRGRVALQDGARFGGPGFARLNAGTGADVLAEAVARMAAALR